MEQRELFARRDDSDTSHEAADRLVATGQLGRDEERARMYVLRFPGRTARELEEIAAREAEVNNTRYSEGAIRKRLSNMRDKGVLSNGEKRRCEVGGHNALTWFVAHGK